MAHNADMKNSSPPFPGDLAHAWQTLQQLSDQGQQLPADANRLAFADPEFLLRRATRGIRMELEMLKPELDLSAQGIEHTIVVFGSARFVAAEQAELALQEARASGDVQGLQAATLAQKNARWYEDARRFAHLVASHGMQQPPAQRLYICTGGGPGIMEAANRGAKEAGAPTVGLNITLPHEQHTNSYVTPALNFKFHYFAARKMHFMMRAKALVAFPGGFGTLDELFEIITLVQTRKSQPLPIVLFGADYWKRLINFALLIEEGLIAASDMQLLHFSDSPQDCWDHIRSFAPAAAAPR